MLLGLSRVVFSQLMKMVPQDGMDSAALTIRLWMAWPICRGSIAADQIPLLGPSSQRMVEPLRENAAVFLMTSTMSVSCLVGWLPLEKVISRRVRILAARDAASACFNRPATSESEATCSMAREMLPMMAVKRLL